MLPAVNIGHSGATATSQRVAVASSNAANVLGTAVTEVGGGQTTGNRQNASGRRDADGDAGFQPLRVEPTGEANPGNANDIVRAATRPIDAPSIAVLEPTHTGADSRGAVVRPNVSVEREFVEVTLARRAYEASIATINTADQSLGTVLDHRF